MAQYNAEYDLTLADGTQGFQVKGAHAGDALGESVSFGDVNGDGLDDLIMGSFGTTNGAAGFVLFGSTAGFAASFNDTSLTQATGIVVKNDGTHIADKTAYLGDINDDGYGDYGFSYGSNNNGVGRAYVLFGSATGPASPIDPTTLTGATGFVINGSGTESLGTGFSGVGDINNDGFADYALGAPFGSAGKGVTYVMLGHAGLYSGSFDQTTLNGTNGFKLVGVGANDGQGASVFSAGDFNGDGTDDLLVSSPTASPLGRNAAGAAYVIFGSPSGFASTAGTIDLSTLTTTVGIQISGASTFNLAGISLHDAGDVNGDGFADVIIGARYADGDAANSGAAYVIFGSATPGNIDLATLTAAQGFKISGVAAVDFAGDKVTGGGDVNGDGFDDVVIGAINATTTSANSGAVYVVFGGATSTNVDLATLSTAGGGDGSKGFQIDGTSHSMTFGSSIAMGDMNNDGLSDIAMGAFNDAPNGSQSGSMYVMYGREPDAAVHRIGTSASQTLAGGEFNDTLDGVSGNDSIYGNGGDDLISAGAGNVRLFGGTGNDGFAMHQYFTAQDKIDGGAGTNDQIGLEGDYSGGITLDGANIKGIEAVAMLPGFDYTINTLDNLVATGQTFTFWSAAMGSANHVQLDAHLETDASYRFFMGQGFDQATGGGGADLFYGEGSQDTITGGGGADTFAYLQVSDSTGDNNFNANDRITDFVHGTDKIKLPFAVAAVDAPITVGGGSNGTANTDLEAAVTTLALHHAVLYTPNSGDAFNAGKTFLIVDANGVAGYQHGADYLIDVTGGTLAGLSASDFTI